MWAYVYVDWTVSRCIELLAGSAPCPQRVNRTGPPRRCECSAGIPSGREAEPWSLGQARPHRLHKTAAAPQKEKETEECRGGPAEAQAACPDAAGGGEV
jgi:hypothetical protein